VREIDALGGAMGRAIDAAGIQFRMLNRRKGPAMHGPRAQADRRDYHLQVRHICQQQPGLSLCQETVDDLLVENKGDKSNFGEENYAQSANRRPEIGLIPFGRVVENEGEESNFAEEDSAQSANRRPEIGLTPVARIVGVRTLSGAEYRARAVVLCTGTFLRGLLHYGQQTSPGGRAGEPATAGVSEALERFGLRLGRFKTGTSPRLDGRTIDYAPLEPQPGDDEPQPFSFLTGRLAVEQVPCWITYTNAAVHELIGANLDRAPMYTGQIRSVGPRYCPSIETKVVRFADKPRHQLFLEPEGRATHEVYVNGLATSLPRDVQEAVVRGIRGLERAEIVRYGYAIEYDFVSSEQLRPSLETKQLAGLYLAGQINGTTGYEEAAGQGLLAGANAALAVQGKQPLVLRRDQAYLGVMIDDLVTRGVDEPYRMFTSRAEHRLRLRHDNADRRLTPIGYRLGLVDEARWGRLQEKEAEIDRAIRLLESTRFEGITLASLLRRPETAWADLVGRLPELATVAAEAAEQVTWDAKYAGYLAREEMAIERRNRLAARQIPEGFDFRAVRHLRAEAREKLARFRPANLAQAGRISGITPADVALLLVHLESKGRGGRSG